MDGLDQNGDRTFRVNFSGDGVGKLRQGVKDKLKDFMGDYTDDTLVVCFSLQFSLFFFFICVYVQ